MSSIITAADLRRSLPLLSDDERQDAADEAEALAAAYAPCLFTPGFNPDDPANGRAVAAFRAIVRRALAYDAGVGSGAVTTKTVSADVFSKSEQIDTRQRQSGVLFSPAQIAALRGLCRPKIAEAGSYSVPLGMPS